MKTCLESSKFVEYLLNKYLFELLFTYFGSYIINLIILFYPKEIQPFVYTLSDSVLLVMLLSNHSTSIIFCMQQVGILSYNQEKFLNAIRNTSVGELFHQ